MTLPTSPETSPRTWKNRMEKYLDRRGRLELWTGLIGAKSLQRADDEQHRNREAESAYVRDKVWGQGKQSSGDDEMGDTILGDVTQTHQHYHQPPTTGGLVKGLIGAGLLATGIGVPVGAWMVADALKQPAQAVVTQPAEKPSGMRTRQYTLGLEKELIEEQADPE